MDETRLVETVDPEEAFTALADGTRIDILRALWAADDPLPFSALRDAVGMRDSGQFNYHLDKLVGRFVRRTDDGYELALAGVQVNGAIHNGAYTMEGAIDPIDLADPCPACGGERVFTYQDEHVRIECDSCAVVATAGVPPGVFAGYEREQVPAVAARYFRTVFQRLENGFCWVCHGRVRPTVRPASETFDTSDTPAAAKALPLVRYDCQQCGADVVSDIGSVLVTHPAVAGFYYDRDVDVRAVPFWEFSAMSTDRAEIRERDPLSAQVRYQADGETLSLVVDETLDVRDIGRPD